MAICANCSSDALYVYQINSVYGINYCQRHLPSFLTRGPQPNLFDVPVEAPVEEAPVEETVAESAPKTKKSQKVDDSTPVAEEPDATNS
jgi:hypothetical protein